MREPGLYWVRLKNKRHPIVVVWHKGLWWLARDVVRNDADFDFISPERLMPPEMPVKE